MRIPLRSPITTRDGSLAKDSLTINCYTEANPNGGVDVVKRPGTSLQRQLSAGTAQCLVSFNGTAFAVIGNSVYNLTTGASAALTTSGTLRMQSLLVNIGEASNFPVIKSALGLWKFTDTTPSLTKCSDGDYPAATVAGIALLDGTYYVLDINGRIYGSDLNNVLSWNALNFIDTDSGISFGIAIIRHLSYIMALCDTGLQLFYDAGNAAPGSPLSPIPNAVYNVGCASADSVVSLDDATIFISKAQTRGVSVSMMKGMSLVLLSTPHIDKILNLTNALQTVYSYGFSYEGHNFYILSLGTPGVTLCCDIDTREWSTWTSGATGGSMFNGAFHVAISPAYSNSVLDYMLNPTSGATYQFAVGNLTDYETAIYTKIRTGIIDGDTIDPKFLGSINLIGDTCASTVTVTYSKDDYTTFSASQTVDLSTVRKQLRRLGSFRRVSFDIVHVAATSFRLQSMELGVAPL